MQITLAFILAHIAKHGQVHFGDMAGRFLMAMSSTAMFSTVSCGSQQWTKILFCYMAPIKGQRADLYSSRRWTMS
ncbi:hypothetical protein SLA2020_025630 [Shorea laevis]